MQCLEGDFYVKIQLYLSTIAKTELAACQASHAAFSVVRDRSATITRFYNYECYTKVYPSLGQHVTYEHEAPQGESLSRRVCNKHLIYLILI